MAGNRNNVSLGGGLICALLGILLTLYNLGIIVGDVQLFWPLLVVALGLSRSVESRSRGRGLALLAVGAALQLSNLSFFVLWPRQLVRYWPLVLVALGLWELARFTEPEELIGGLTLSLLGVWFQLSYFGLAHISSYRFWPLLLTAIGLGMVKRSLGGERLTAQAGPDIGSRNGAGRRL
jgi:hypothetical protein